MRLFERCVYKNEIVDVICDSIDSDQYAYKVGHNSTMALIKCQHTWLKRLDKDAKYVRILSFDFSKAFDSVPHDILFKKVKRLPFNPYITNWMINFLKDRKQKVTVDGITTEFLRINRGVPQGTVLGPILFSIMVNDIKSTNPINELCKFADDITVEVPGYDSSRIMRVLAQKLGESPFSLFPLPTTQTTHHCARTLMIKPPNQPPTNTNKPTPQPIRVLEHILEDPPKFFHS